MMLWKIRLKPLIVDVGVAPNVAGDRVLPGWLEPTLDHTRKTFTFL